MNSLQKPHNYYEKYMKYKTKYIEYKNNLMVVNGKRGGWGAIVGGGKSASIKFLSSINPEIIHPINEMTDMTIKPLYIKIMVAQESDRVYEVVEQVGKGTTGTVFKIKQIIPQQPESEPQQPPSQIFVIKLTILKNVNDDAHNEMEGINIEQIYVPDRVQALFQGKTDKIDFAIFNYLGQDFKTFLRDYSSTMTAKTILLLITRLHNQLYGLNRRRFFHNDIKMPNIVVNVVTKVDEKTGSESTEYVPSIIDYGCVTSEKSQMGTTESMCLYGCASFLLEEITEEEKKKEKEKEEEKLKTELIKLQSKAKAVSSDYVGFFNIIICLLSPNYYAYQIYHSILKLKAGYSPYKLLHILCLLCYVSNSAECDDFLAMPQCAKIVQKIDNYFKQTLEEDSKIMPLFTSLLPKEEQTTHMHRRLLFLCYLYIIIRDFNTETYFNDYVELSKFDPNKNKFVKVVEFIHISKLPKFLLDISCCLDLQFDLVQFNANFGKIFNEELSEPAPEPTADEPPTYISSVSQIDVSIKPQTDVSRDPPYILKEVDYKNLDYNNSPY
jgi:hypothetical protein